MLPVAWKNASLLSCLTLYLHIYLPFSGLFVHATSSILTVSAGCLTTCCSVASGVVLCITSQLLLAICIPLRAVISGVPSSWLCCCSRLPAASSCFALQPRRGRRFSWSGGVVQGVHFGYILVYWACSFALMLASVSHLVLCPCVL